MAAISMKALLETGVHFGHRTQKWNPKMKPYIFTERNGIHIIDLQQTVTALDQVYNLVRDTVAKGGVVLFVGTKRQAQESIQKEAERCGMPYINQRWLGGTLTNWKTIKERINELKKLPDLLFIVDVHREETAVREANVLGVPVVALVDTNCDPGGVDYVIPANDDAILAIKLLTAKLADAAAEGRALRKDAPEAEAAEGEYGEKEAKDEDLLGPAIRAKMESGELEFKDETAGSEAQA